MEHCLEGNLVSTEGILFLKLREEGGACLYSNGSREEE